MDRHEAILRELNLYPQWKLRVQSAPAVQQDPAPMSAAAESIAPAVAVRKMPPVPGSSTAGGRADIGSLGWAELKQQVRDCTACKLRAGCSQTVFGVGDEKADWLFVGEGPGADEDVQGEPFVGQAGKLLDNMLMAIKLKRSHNVYIANIIKCRPPRQPQPGSG